MHSYCAAEFAPINAATGHGEVKDVLVLGEFIHRPQVPCREWQAIEVFDVWTVCVSNDFAI
jgi:hypothetical protein